MNERDPVENLADIRHEFGEHGGVNMSIEASTTFTVMDPTTIPEIFEGGKGPDQGGCYLYGRHFNPTVYNLGRQFAAIEGSEAAYCTASGMGAIAAALLAVLNTGDHVVASSAIYGGTYALLHDFLPAKAGIETTLVDVSDPDAVTAAITPRTRVVYAESFANPTLRVADIPALARIAHGAGAALVIDNTFSPLLMAPVEHGADVVVHSVTKFISGTSDIIAGAVCAKEPFIQGLMNVQTGPLMLLGPTMDPKVAFEISTRLPHLALRMAEHGRRAGAIAAELEGLGLSVVYPGLASHPDHELAMRLCRPAYGFGGVLGLDVADAETANRLMERLQNRYRFGYMAVSLGYFDTLMSLSGSSTSSELTEADKDAAGISPGYIRISVGYTGSVDQRLEQLRGALGEVGLI
jgi:methionine-gamma-lyase